MVLLHAGQRDELGPPAGACDDSVGCSSHGVLVSAHPPLPAPTGLTAQAVHWKRGAHGTAVLSFATSRDGVIAAACR